MEECIFPPPNRKGYIERKVERRIKIAYHGIERKSRLSNSKPAIYTYVFERKFSAINWEGRYKSTGSYGGGRCSLQRPGFL